MRIFNTLGERTRVGVRVMEVADPAQHFEVRVMADGNNVLARVSFSDFDEMVRRGHAVNVPSLTWSREYMMSGMVMSEDGGRVIFRCDAEVRANGEVWLVPEASETKAILAFILWDSWMDADRTMSVGEGANQLVEAIDETWRKHYCLITMQPGSSLNFAGTRDVAVPATGLARLNPMRQQRWTKVPVNRGSVKFNGETVAL